MKFEDHGECFIVWQDKTKIARISRALHPVHEVRVVFLRMITVDEAKEIVEFANRLEKGEIL